MKQINSLLLLLVVLITSCNGQDKTRLPKDSEPKTSSAGQSRVIKIEGTPYGNIGCGLLDRRGNLWFSASGKGVYCYDGETFANFTEKDGLINNNVNAIIEDRAGNILFGTKGGVSCYDGKSFANLTDNSEVNNNTIWSLLEDREGNLWLGTMNSGVYRYDGKTFTNFLNNDDHAFNLDEHHQAIMDILQDKSGNIWFCSWNRGGVWRYDGKSFVNFLPSVDYYQPKDSAFSYGKTFAGYKSKNLPQATISDDMIFSISEDKAGNLWFATRRHGACRYDGKYFTSFTENAGLANVGMYAVVEDKSGDLWFATEKDGVWRYDGKTFANFTTKDGLANNSVFSIVEDKAGNLWFGTRGFGLSRYDGSTFTKFSEYSDDIVK